MMIENTIEQIHLDNLLIENKPEESLNYIFTLLKNDKKGDIYFKLLSISYLNIMASDYFFSDDKKDLFLNAIRKSESLIKSIRLKHKKNEYIGYEAYLNNSEAALNFAKFKFSKIIEKKSFVEYTKYLQIALSNYWRSLRIEQRSEEKYNIRNNLANALTQIGRFIEAFSLFNFNIKEQPNRFESIASLGDAMLNFKQNVLLPDTPAFYFSLAEIYSKAANNVPKNFISDIKNCISYCAVMLKKMKFQLSEKTLFENKETEQKDFNTFSKYRKYVLEKNLSLNEHSLYCHCRHSECDDLSISLYGGSKHTNTNFKIIESYLNRLKSEYSFARLLFYKYETFDKKNDSFYYENDYNDASFNQNETEFLGYKIEHLRASYRILYGLLDKIASAILQYYNITNTNKQIYFESVFHQFSELQEQENIHLYALFSMSLDLSQSTDAKEVGSLGFYKKIRNKLEHGLLILHKEETNLETMSINIEDFKNFVEELLILTRSAIFSFNYLIRTETIIKRP
jgi:hypothetical protein